MTASWHVVAKLLIVSRMSKVDYRIKVLPTVNNVCKSTRQMYSLKKIEYDAQVMRITLNILCLPILTDPVIFYFYYMKRAARIFLFSTEESQSYKFGKTWAD